jgi:hypothetical protein
VETVHYNEFVQLKDGSPTKFWKEKPVVMIKKVAKSVALRKAFNINGVYSPEEMGLYEDDGIVVIAPDQNENKVERARGEKVRPLKMSTPAPAEPAETVVEAAAEPIQPAAESIISEQDINRMRTEIHETKTDEVKFCAFIGVSVLEDLTVSLAEKAFYLLDQKRKTISMKEAA